MLFIGNLVTTATQWNYIQLVRFIVSMPVVIIYGLISTMFTRQGIYFWNFSNPNGLSEIGVCLFAFWILFAINPIAFLCFFWMPSVVSFRNISQREFSSRSFSPNLCVFIHCFEVSFFVSFFLALLAAIRMLIWTIAPKIEIINWFLQFAFIAYFFHFVLLTKMPVTAWDKHDATGKVDFNTQYACLSQTYSIRTLYHA